MPPERASTGKIVFVGNIPYGLTEEQITEIFASAGRVLSFRLVYDRETGRPKGFGFAEYPDQETAASAVRNLDNYEIMGRKLRVDFSHEGNAPDGFEDSGPPVAAAASAAAAAGGAAAPSLPTQTQAAPNHQTLPNLPSGAELPAGLSAPDAISRTLGTLSPPQLLDIIGQMKTLVSTDPLKATELLRQAPQLSYAIFQALLLMNLVDTSVLTQVIENAAAPPPPSAAVAAPQSQAPPTSSTQQQTQYTYAPPPPSQQQPPQQHQQQQYPQQSTTPVLTSQQQPPPPPGPPGTAPTAAVAAVAADPQRAALLQQVMSLTQEQIGALPAEQQQQILMLKHQLMAGGGF